MKILIIGNGVAGTNTARWIRKLSNYEIVLVSDETLQPYSRTALMYVYMGHVKQKDTWLYEDGFWAKNRIDRVMGRVQTVLADEKRVILQDGQAITFDKLVLATGSKPNKFGWPGQNLQGVSGLYHLQDLEAMETHSPGLQHAVIVGGGLIGIEMAEMFHSRGIGITFLVRESSFWNIVLPDEESQMINRHIKEHGINLMLETELKEIIDNGSGKVKAVLTNKGETIDCQYVGLTVGVSPNIAFLENSGIETNRGIMVDELLQTSHPDIYAIGDCAEIRKPNADRRPIEAIWYTGRMMGQTVAHNICNKPNRYDPGIWFNSAKFLDIEYQVYGNVPAKMPDDQAELYWEHPNGKKAIRIRYQAETLAVTGFNLMGVRYRHEVCETWLRAKTSIETVLSQLELANFDPEFFDVYEPNLRALYEKTTNKKLQRAAKP